MFAIWLISPLFTLWLSQRSALPHAGYLLVAKCHSLSADVSEMMPGIMQQLGREGMADLAKKVQVSRACHFAPLLLWCHERIKTFIQSDSCLGTVYEQGSSGAGAGASGSGLAGIQEEDDDDGVQLY